MNLDKYKQPEGKLSELNVATTILENAPECIMDLEEMKLNAESYLAGERARVALENKEEKQQIIKALQDTDEKVSKYKKELAQVVALLAYWTEAQTNARNFYRKLERY